MANRREKIEYIYYNEGYDKVVSFESFSRNFTKMSDYELNSRYMNTQDCVIERMLYKSNIKRKRKGTNHYEKQIRNR